VTDTEILEAGALCEALLSSLQFKTIVSLYEQTIASDILATKQEDKDKREALYSSLWGTRGLLEFMKLNADAAATIKAPKPPEQDGTTDYAPIDYDFDDEGFPRANESDDY
jgi:hypothetical protein